MNNHLHDERRLAYKVRLILDQSVSQLAPSTHAKLHAARQRALARQKSEVLGLSLAGVSQFTSEVLLPRVRTMIALVVLAVGVVGTYYWNNFQQAAENEEIDSALLSDELPINAYLDHGFSAWLEHPVQSSQE